MFLSGHMFRILHSFSSQVVVDALADSGLTSSQGMVILYLCNCGKTLCPKDIENLFSLSHPTVSNLLTYLEKEGFVELRTDETDRRCKRIYLLPKAKETGNVVREAIEENEQRITRGFTEEEKVLFSKLLMKAVENVGGKKHLSKQKEVYRP